MNVRTWSTLLWALCIAFSMRASECPIIDAQTSRLAQSADADWLIVGAGPAGILTIGVLMDLGVHPQRITWIDPEFHVGRLGKYYANMPSNNRARDFISFMNACATFKEGACQAMDRLNKMDPTTFCDLNVVVEPLQCVSDYLRTKVVTLKDSMIGLSFDNGLWYVQTAVMNRKVCAHNVVLATGSHPRELSYNLQTVIPLDYALDKPTLASLLSPTDTVGVVGGAHSAILLLRYLSTMRVRQVYNFYRHPITYAIDQGCWATDPLGIKGSTAEWAQQVLEKNPPKNLTRIQVTDQNQLGLMLKQCTKVIYAVGYDRNELPAINNNTPITSYNDTTGVIAPRLFGIGVAFPEKKTDDGHERHLLGLNCFMDYAQRLIPQWIDGMDFNDYTKRSQRAAAQRKVFEGLSDLITIYSL